LLTGGGDRSLGDTGHRGVSLISDVWGGFWGAGALRVGSEATGGKLGVEATDSALCVAAADRGLVDVLADREGLISWELFFLALPGPVTERLEVFALGCGRIGELSLDGIGELVVDGVRFV